MKTGDSSTKSSLRYVVEDRDSFDGKQPYLVDSETGAEVCGMWADCPEDANLYRFFAVVVVLLNEHAAEVKRLRAQVEELERWRPKR